MLAQHIKDLNTRKARRKFWEITNDRKVIVDAASAGVLM